MKTSLGLLIGLLVGSVSSHAGWFSPEYKYTLKGSYYSNQVDLGIQYYDRTYDVGVTGFGVGETTFAGASQKAVQKLLKTKTVGSLRVGEIDNLAKTVEVEMAFQNPELKNLVASQSDTLKTKGSFRVLSCDGVSTVTAIGLLDQNMAALNALTLKNISSCILGADSGFSVSEAIAYSLTAEALTFTSSGVTLGQKTFFREQSAPTGSISLNLRKAVESYIAHARGYGFLIVNLRNASDEVWYRGLDAYKAQHSAAMVRDLETIQKETKNASLATKLAVMHAITLAQLYMKEMKQEVDVNQGRLVYRPVDPGV